MTKPLLYVKKGCPYCRAAMEHLDAQKIAYEPVEVRSNASAMQKLRDISGQDKTPTLQWDDEVLANFGVDELEDFLQKRAPKS